MQIGVLFRLCVLWGFVVLTSSLTKAVKKKGTGRRSRQVFGAELPEGVWSPWGEWSSCSQSCGVGVAQRSRKCLPPPPPPPRQTPPLSHAPPHWGASFSPSSSSLFTPGGVGAPVVSANHPYYPPRYPGNQHGGGAEPERQLPPYYSPALSANQSPGLSLYRDTPAAADGEGGASNPALPFYRPEFSAANQEQPPVSVYRSPSYPGAPHGYNQPTRISRRPANPSATRGSGGGNRRSSSIRPGQFGYGRVPFSLPLHRPNRQARHTANGTVTAATPGPDAADVDDTDRAGEDETEKESEGRKSRVRGAKTEEEEEMKREEEEEMKTEEETGTHSPAPGPTVAMTKSVRPERQTGRPERQTGRPERQTGRPLHPHAAAERGRGGERVQPHTRPFPPSQRAFDWHTVTAPPPPLHPHSPPYYSSPLHRPAPQHRERELQAGPGPQASAPHARPPQPNIYPLQRTQPPHLGPEGQGGSSQTYRCAGEDKEHRKCFSQVCGGGLDPRAEQCAAFNTQEFMGRLYDWEPFTEVGLEKQCELTCRPAGYRFYVRQAETVRDGTPCINTSTNDVCLAGRCLSEGCDGVLGSARVIDRCGVCGGLEVSCRKVSGSFQNSTVPLGYHKILDIPMGATAINITEKHASSNYLALRSGTGGSVVNGRWAVDPPGEYTAGGTTFTYSRPRAQGEGQGDRGESLTAPGPTTTILQLYIIFHKQNPGIDYEFYIPVENREAEREREQALGREREQALGREREHALGREREQALGREREQALGRERELSVGRERSREWTGEPERPRDGGRSPLRATSSLTVAVEDPILPPPVFAASSSASERWTPEQPRPRVAAPNRNARIPPRTDLPPDTQPPFVWRRGSFTVCSASCGTGSRYRLVLCVNRHTEEEVSNRKCDSAARPSLDEEACNTQPCPAFWEASAWSECSVSCGEGVQQRQLQCRQSFGNLSTMVHPQHCALLPPPDSTQSCQLQLCSHWEASPDWSTCSVDCGVGKRTRSVRCVSDHGNVVNDKECSSRLRPQGSEDCHMGPCVTNWYFTDWSNTCSAHCGPGVQRREVFCLTRGRGREGGGGGDCVGDSPADMRACNRGPCVPTHLWFSSPWTQCSAPCGNGNQRRDVVCVRKLGTDFTVTPASECAHLDKPPSVQECEGEPCRARWFTTEWSTCSRSCGKGLQVREVRCLTADKQHSQECETASRPEQEQLCNTIPCGPVVTDENCRDRRHNCMMVVQARLCVYSYYKTACCASCTQSAQRSKRH